MAPNSIIKDEHALKCNFNYSFEQYKQNPICIPGYPSEKEIQDLKSKGLISWQSNSEFFYDEQPALK